MKVITVIVTHNGGKWIEQCLSSLGQSSFPVETIVIDNASADNTTSIVKERFLAVELIDLDSNIGFGQANNIGLKAALNKKADYIFLLNQDAWVKQDTVYNLLQASANLPEYGILSPFHLDASEQQLERQFAEFISAKYNDLLVSDMFFHRLKGVYDTTYIHAASWFMSRKCVETVGGFDPLFFHYGEDDDYMQRAKHFGFRLGLVPAALVVHDAVYKTWQHMEWDVNRNRVNELQQLKKMFPHFRTNVLAYLKASFDELTTLLVFRKFKKFRFRAKIIWKTLQHLNAIRSSYKASFTKGAFLQ